MPQPTRIEFDSAPVEHDRNVRDCERVVHGVRWALVEYAPGSARDGWCSEPHMGYVISGQLEYAFEDGSPPLSLKAGEGFALAPSPGHAGHNPGSEPARIFVIDALADAGGNGEPPGG